MPLGKSFYLFGDAGLNGYSIYRKQVQASQPGYYNKENGYAFNVGVMPGLACQVKKSLFLEIALNNLLSMGFTRINLEHKTTGGELYTGENNSFNLYSNLSNGVPIQVGARWIIAR